MDYVRHNKQVSTDYLDMKHIQECCELTKIAYVHDISFGQTKYQDGFIKFFLKDCNSEIVVARLFRPENFMLSGVNAASFKHKPVIFKCVAQAFNGSLSLVLCGDPAIQVYQGEFDYKQFIGQAEFDLSALQQFYNEIDPDWVPPVKWGTSSVDSILNGKAGGFARLAECAFSCLIPFLTENNANELLPSFVIAMENWFDYIQIAQNTEVVGSLPAYDILQTISTRYCNDNNKLLYLDCTRAVIGTDKPMHFFAHLIKDAVTYSKKMLQLSDKFSTQLLGTKCFTGGVELSKY